MTEFAERTARVAEIVSNAETLTAAAIGCKAAGFTPQECAPVLLGQYAGTSADTMAGVLAAVWPEPQYANPTYLTQALVDAPYDPTVAAAAAKQALGVYHDLYMRDGLSDTGTVPSRVNDPWTSPDIVPAGSTPLSDPGQTLTSTYGSDIGTNINLKPQTNYVYVRARNLFPDATTGTVTVYWSLASLLLKPSIWTQHPLANSNGTHAADLVADAAGEIVAGDSPFLWSPDAPPSGDHYCLVAQVVTAYHPDPIPPDDSLPNFGQWVRDNPGIAWRNTAQVPVTGRLAQSSVGFSNPEAQALRYLLTATCTSLPVGTTVGLSCAAPGPVPPIETGFDVTQPSQTFTFGTTLPAGFDALLVVSILLPSTAPVLTSSANVAVAFLLDAEPESEYADLATAPVGPSRLAQGVAEGTPVYLGDFVFEYVPAAALKESG